ncbi:MAG TPA: TIR domain-containing protein [Bryobacteraceae bacterium]|nr:TIR domain-containing protein [Bryobacteraceae bacterium]
MEPTPIFLSWSGTRSKMLAEALRDWLPDLVVVAKPWFSEKDIDKGLRWSDELAGQLSTCNLAVVCVTPENADSPWLVFEAGALSKLRDARVWTYVLDASVPNGSPLRQFQYAAADEAGTRDLVRSIGKKLLPEDGLAKFLTRQFERCWPDFNAALDEIRKIRPLLLPVQGRFSVEDMLMRGPQLLAYIGANRASEDIVEAVVGRFERTPLAAQLGHDHLADVTRRIFNRDLRSAEAFLDGFGLKPELQVSLILQILFYGSFER